MTSLSPAALLFVLRLLLAGLLYAFLGAIAWLLGRDLRAAARAAQTRAQRRGRLTVVASAQPALVPGAAFPLLAISSLGRAPTNTVPLADEACSLEHALVHLRSGQWWLEDLGSRNGTRLNGAPVTQPTPILAGDIVELGQVQLKFEPDEPAPDSGGQPHV